MIVEGQRTDFWTRVRLPSSPLEHEAANPLRGNYYCVYKNVFAMILDFDVVEGNSLYRKAITTTHSDIRKWVCDNLNITISNSSIGRVMEKCGITSLNKNQMCDFPNLRSDKEKAIMTAFLEMNIVVKK